MNDTRLRDKHPTRAPSFDQVRRDRRRKRVYRAVTYTDWNPGGGVLFRSQLSCGHVIGARHFNGKIPKRLHCQTCADAMEKAEANRT